MRRLFSPWRMPYIGRDKKAEKVQGCVFCRALKQEDGPENLIVHRGRKAFVIVNRFPYTSGHLMVLPFEHVAKLDEIDEAARAELIELTNQATLVLAKVYDPGGFNLGANLGAAAGAGIEEHLHLHILPRWFGDTNFVSTVGETRVLPEELEETWRRVSAAW
ncbi:MAG: HIT domain-containing protein [Anaerolineales bacterium]